MALELVRGDSRTLIATFSLLGAPASLGGCSLVLTISNVVHNVKQVYTSAANQIVINATAGTASCAIDTTAYPNVNASYAFEWALTDSLGNKTTMRRDAIVVFAEL